MILRDWIKSEKVLIALLVVDMILTVFLVAWAIVGML